MQFAAVETFLHIRDPASVFHVGNSKTGRFWAINAITRIEGSMSEIAWLRKPSENGKGRHRTFSCYCSFAYSALACFKMGMSGSASFQSVRKSW